MREPRAHRRSLLSLLVLLGTAACDDAPVAPTARDEAPTERVDESPVTAPELTPSETCARDLAAETPAAVRATIDDLGYALLFDDACVAERAERDDTPALCDELSVSTLRERCTVRVAVRHARPDACPSARTIEGRDPLCVALAARDRRLCMAAGLIDRAVCERALGRERGCAQLPESERETCEARASDLASRVDGDVRTTPAFETTCTITSDGTSRTPTSAAHGARLVYRACTRVLVLGDPDRLTTPYGPAAIAMELALDAPGEVTFGLVPTGASSSLAVTLDGSHALHASGGTASLVTLDAELGGSVEGTFHATFAGHGGVDGAFHTFVRDLEPRPAACGPE